MRFLGPLAGAGLSAAAAAAADVAAGSGPVPDPFATMEPGRFFLLLTLIATVGAGGRVLVQWRVDQRWPHLVGSLLLAIAVADVVALLLWGQIPPPAVMGTAGATAALGGEAIDALLRAIVRARFPVGDARREDR